MDHIKELNDFERNLVIRFHELDDLKSKYVLEEQDILHYIEFEKYDAATGAKLLKKLKETRKDRREIKNEYEDLQSILKKFNNAGLHKFRRPKKTYTYRTVTISSILGINE